MLPALLQRQGLKFTYQQVYVNHPTYEASRHRFSKIESDKPFQPDSPLIFVATEVIEHLHCEQEIAHEAARLPRPPDIIHVSTPLYTFNPNVKHWTDIGWLGHLRTYTPKEFQSVVCDMFRAYEFAYYESNVQHIRLVSPATKFDCIRKHYQFQGESNEEKSA